MLRLHIKLNYPQPRHIERACEVLRSGGLIVFPTDSAYSLGCDIFAKRSIEKIYQLKGINRSHRLSFLCSDLAQVSRYAMVENQIYRILRHHMPGPFTFILPATREVPRLLQTNARTVGVRVPANPVCSALLKEFDNPLLISTAVRHIIDETVYANDPDKIFQQFGKALDLLLDGGPLYNSDLTSIIDLTKSEPSIVRRGLGDLSWFEKNN
ncbi:MAG: threonylcarbamoyl-AMP synthase [Deltaproteobacteria bacterium]|nr:threonylcarbamoyl-AMP synthase [Deltaproteobacteria bacterium]